MQNNSRQMIAAAAKRVISIDYSFVRNGFDNAANSDDPQHQCFAVFSGV